MCLELTITHVNHIDNTGIHGAFQGVHMQISGTSVQQRGSMIYIYIPKIILHVWAVVMINVGLSPGLTVHSNKFIVHPSALA